MSKPRGRPAGAEAGRRAGGEPIDSAGGDQGEGSFTDRASELSTLQLFDVVASRFPASGERFDEISYLRGRIAELEETFDEARGALEKFNHIVQELRSPAFRVGTLIATDASGSASVCINGADYVCRIDPAIPADTLEAGQQVYCNEAYAVVQGGGFDRSGPIVRVDEVLSEGRLKVGQDAGGVSMVVGRSALVAKEKVKPGLDVRLDSNQRFVLEIIGRPKRIDRALAIVTAIPWSSIGGQVAAVESIRETIEWPLLHRELFQEFRHRIPKGFLLHGPPGCGKTLLGKAAAYNLCRQSKETLGVDRSEFFLHVKGPEILNMWVGESERQVRDLFLQCRERAREGAMAFLFVDEAEAILGARHGGRHHTMSETLVPMFCTEMDGLDPLSNVVVILASNRADLIDPAILRPGRIDRKIKVTRPSLADAKRIYAIYLENDLPLDGDSVALADAIAEAHYRRCPDNEFLEVVFRSGKREIMYRGDMASGAIVAAVVERAKSLAIKRSIAAGRTEPIRLEELTAALDQEYLENELFPKSDLTEDWLRLTDFDDRRIVRLGPVRGKELESEPSWIV